MSLRSFGGFEESPTLACGIEEMPDIYAASSSFSPHFVPATGRNDERARRRGRSLHPQSQGDQVRSGDREAVSRPQAAWCLPCHTERKESKRKCRGILKGRERTLPQEGGSKDEQIVRVVAS